MLAPLLSRWECLPPLCVPFTSLHNPPSTMRRGRCRKRPSFPNLVGPFQVRSDLCLQTALSISLCLCLPRGERRPRAGISLVGRTLRARVGHRRVVLGSGGPALGTRKGRQSLVWYYRTTGCWYLHLKSRACCEAVKFGGHGVPRASVAVLFRAQVASVLTCH